MTKRKAESVKAPIVAYKGFDSDLKCRGFQFEIGKTYIHEGDVVACSSGFHSCSNPLDVLNYYDVTSRFALVEIGGKTSTNGDDSKIASAEITIKAELNLPDFISECVKRLIDICGNGSTKTKTASGDSSQLAASGYSSQLAASGDYSQLAASGYSSKLAASGDYSIACCSGTNGRVKGGKNCAMSLARWVESEQRYRITVAYVGEDGIKEDTWYRLDEYGNFVED